MNLYVARHTETNYNVELLCNSDPTVDVHLTERGIEQAKQLAKQLAKVELEVIYISELPRTRQTADIINEHHHVPLIVDKRVNDNAAGFEGRPIAEYLQAFNDSPDKWNQVFNGGESLAQARERVEDFLSDMRKQDYSEVLIVTHGYIVECIHGIINNLSYDEAAGFKLNQGEFAQYSL